MRISFPFKTFLKDSNVGDSNKIKESLLLNDVGKTTENSKFYKQSLLD